MQKRKRLAEEEAQLRREIDELVEKSKLKGQQAMREESGEEKIEARIRERENFLAKLTKSRELLERQERGEVVLLPEELSENAKKNIDLSGSAGQQSGWGSQAWQKAKGLASRLAGYKDMAGIKKSEEEYRRGVEEEKQRQREERENREREERERKEEQEKREKISRALNTLRAKEKIMRDEEREKMAEIERNRMRVEEELKRKQEERERQEHASYEPFIGPKNVESDKK